MAFTVQENACNMTHIMYFFESHSRHPILHTLADLLPTLLIGPALGAAVVFVVQEGKALH